MSSTKDPVMSTLTIELANLDLKKHTQAIINLLNLFSKDKMGQNEPLEEGIKKDVIQELRKHPTTLVFLAFKDEQPIGLVTAFLGFSTFIAKQTLKNSRLGGASRCTRSGCGKIILLRNYMSARVSSLVSLGGGI